MKITEKRFRALIRETIREHFEGSARHPHPHGGKTPLAISTPEDVPNEERSNYHFDRINGVYVRNDYNPRSDLGGELDKAIAALKEGRLGGDLDDIGAPRDHPFFTKKPRTRTISYTASGYQGRRIHPRDRAWLEFVPKGSPSQTREDMFRAVTLLKPTDPEIQKALDDARPDLVRSIGNLDQYDVYSVYATTTG
jgi:hypothetical protein